MGVLQQSGRAAGPGQYCRSTAASTVCLRWQLTRFLHCLVNSQDGACADYTRAIELDPTDTAPFNGRAFAGLREAALQDAPAAQTTLQRALNDVDRALGLDDSNGPAHCTRGAILKQMALSVANGATDKAAAAAVGGEAEKEWMELIEAGIAAQRAAMRLEPDAEEPRDYLKELLAMLGIEEQVADVHDRSDWSNSVSSVPAPHCDKTGQPSCKEGWLHKKGGLKDGERNWVKGGKRNWKARWVALDGNCIRWHDVKGGKELGNMQMTVLDRVELDADKYATGTTARYQPPQRSHSTYAQRLHKSCFLADTSCVRCECALPVLRAACCARALFVSCGCTGCFVPPV
eukprot:COSAG02_NODE_2131_length_9725_cov_239.696343_7_plen_346_part_00